jgi:hypothetical protein
MLQVPVVISENYNMTSGESKNFERIGMLRHTLSPTTQDGTYVALSHFFTKATTATNFVTHGI